MLVSDETANGPSPDPRWRIIYNRRLEFEASESFRLLRARGIEPILIKGWAVARKYPPENPRFYDDVDLAVSAEDYQEAKAVLSSPEAGKLGIDLHNELRHLDTRSWRELFDDSVVVDLHGSPVRVLSEEDHLRILAVHWLSDGGIRKHRLWDIYYSLAGPTAEFSWDRCLGVVSERRQGWVIASVALAHKYLGLSIEGFPFAEKARRPPKWLTKTVEREWKWDTPYLSLHLCIYEPRELFRQVRRRLPPNPIQATINREGELWKGSRIPYQLGNIADRALPSLKGILHMLKPRKQ